MDKKTLSTILILTGIFALDTFSGIAQLEEADYSGNYKLTRQWPGPEGKPLPFKHLDEVADFLKTARIEEMEEVDEGVTGVRKILLEKDGVRIHAVFRDVNISKPLMRFPDGTSSLNFRDDAIFECAAYELSRLLQFKYVPPAVPRSIDGRTWYSAGLDRRRENGKDPQGKQAKTSGYLAEGDAESSQTSF